MATEGERRNDDGTPGCFPLWVSALTTLILLTAVLIVAPFLSTNSPYSVSYEVVYWYEFLVMKIAVVATIGAIFIRLRKENKNNAGNEYHNMNSSRDEIINLSENFSLNSSDRTDNFVLPKFRLCVILVCGVGTCVLPIFEINNISYCINEVTENKLMYIMRIVSLSFILLFILVEMIWFLGDLLYPCSGMLFNTIKGVREKSFLRAIGIMFIILANIILCIRCVLDTIRASNSRMFAAGNESLSDNYFDVTLTFSHCSNNTEVVDAGSILRAFRYTYSFPFQFGFLALSMIACSYIHSNENNVSQSTSKENVDYVKPISTDMKLNLCWRFVFCVLKFLFYCIVWLLQRWSHIFSLVLVGAFSICYIIFVCLSGMLTSIDESASDNTFTGWLHGSALAFSFIYASIPVIMYFYLWKNKVSSKLGFNGYVLIFCAVGYACLCLFEGVDALTLLVGGHIHVHNTRVYEGIYVVSLVCRMFGIYCQLMVIINSHGLIKTERQMEYRNDDGLGNKSTNHKDIIWLMRGALLLLGYGNGIRWFTGLFFPAPALTQVQQIKALDLFGEKNWWLVIKLFTPLDLLFNILSSEMCFSLAAKIKAKYNTPQQNNTNNRNNETSELVT